MYNSHGTITCLQHNLERGSGEAQTSHTGNDVTLAAKFDPKSFGAFVASTCVANGSSPLMQARAW